LQCPPDKAEATMEQLRSKREARPAPLDAMGK